MVDEINFVVLIIICIYSFRMAYLIGVKGRLNLLYSINQVKMLHMDARKKLKISRYIAIIYIITGIGLVITYYNL